MSRHDNTPGSEGRQGRGALTHIMSPAMVAAAAIFGRLADVRRLS